MHGEHAFTRAEQFVFWLILFVGLFKSRPIWYQCCIRLLGKPVVQSACNMITLRCCNYFHSLTPYPAEAHSCARSPAKHKESKHLLVSESLVLPRLDLQGHTASLERRDCQRVVERKQLLCTLDRLEIETSWVDRRDSLGCLNESFRSPRAVRKHNDIAKVFRSEKVHKTPNALHQSLGKGWERSPRPLSKKNNRFSHRSLGW